MSIRRAYANNALIASSPRFVVEALGMVVIATVAFALANTDEGSLGVVPLLGVIAVGAQRMLPMLQQFYASITNMRGSQEVIRDTLYY